MLLPLETPEDQKRILSMNLTGAFVSEAIEIDFDLMVAIAGRCGRFPSAADGGASWYGVVLDSNMPTEGTPWQKTVATPPPGWQVFVQPSGLSAEAENLNWLLQTPTTLALPIDHPERLAKGREYYERLSTSTNPAWVKRYVMAEFGPDPSGAAVYAGMFFSGFHCRDELLVIPGAPLLIGLDLGRDPWAVLGQIDSMSRLLVHEEIPADDIGLRLQLPRIRQVVSGRRYVGCPVCIIFDPAGMAKSQHDELTSLRRHPVVRFHVHARTDQPAGAATQRGRAVPDGEPGRHGKHADQPAAVPDLGGGAERRLPFQIQPDWREPADPGEEQVSATSPTPTSTSVRERAAARQRRLPVAWCGHGTLRICTARPHLQPLAGRKHINQMCLPARWDGPAMNVALLLHA